jgi:predicted transcriptional regulator
MATPTMTVRIPKDIHDDLKRLAEKNHRSVNGEAAFAIEAYLEAHREIVDALRPQETGR